MVWGILEVSSWGFSRFLSPGKKKFPLSSNLRLREEQQYIPYITCKIEVVRFWIGLIRLFIDWPQHCEEPYYSLRTQNGPKMLVFLIRFGAWCLPGPPQQLFGSTANLQEPEARIHVIYPYFFNLPLYASNINANGAFTHISNILLNFIKVILFVTAILCNYLGFGGLKIFETL